MDESARNEYELKSKQLRAELKGWESEWASRHDGNKPGRDDIKRNADIAQKYKEYQQARDVLSGKAAPPKKDKAHSKRKAGPATADSPQKRKRPFETPSHERIQHEEYMNSPGISRKLFSPQPVAYLGPTPQRDGRVLGLFDLLVEKELGTPSRKSHDNGEPNAQTRIQATPSKVSSSKRRHGFSTEDDDAGGLRRTPVSASKRRMLNSFMTPLKGRRDHAGRATPTSASALQFDTPAFLKRHSLTTVDEHETFDKPISSLRLPRKPFARGLSEIVASLRRVEEEQADEDLEALREMEAEEIGGSVPKKTHKSHDEVLVADSQTQRLLLGGLDDEGKYDSPAEDMGGDTAPVFKKKGQKRTTRKVNIRPTRAIRPADVTDAQGDASDEGSEPEPAHDVDDIESKAASGKPPVKEARVKKSVRKVNELAHANFRRLKIKKKGGRGCLGRSGRFRTRR